MFGTSVPSYYSVKIESQGATNGQKPFVVWTKTGIYVRRRPRIYCRLFQELELEYVIYSEWLSHPQYFSPKLVSHQSKWFCRVNSICYSKWRLPIPTVEYSTSTNVSITVDVPVRYIEEQEIMNVRRLKTTDAVNGLRGTIQYNNTRDDNENAVYYKIWNYSQWRRYTLYVLLNNVSILELYQLSAFKTGPYFMHVR